ncbi:NfeD family protein [Kamptonema cortianum]|nr:NfeD family protein [Oscillatoria laete-virens]MDK3159907.1 NfeD family protein [Kamptonema cortianum]MDL5050526.1 NfeD family protein [Oscillatoria amoena NRMC-F 0135]MDL5055538.1 NfeD family protein [Oscillatoria laete-virens NRMC-F 0139]
MIRHSLLLKLFLGILTALPTSFAAISQSESPSGTAQPQNDGPVYVIPIDGEINSPLLYFVRRSMKEAESKKARAVVLEMDTPGGRLDVCLKIMDLLGKFDGQTVTYIKNDALSAGALISISTQKIYMAPKAVIGASAPVMAGGQEVPETANDKIISVLKAKARSFARENGYNLQLVEAFIDKDTEVIIEGKVINKKGSLLTLTADEATERLGPNQIPVLASGIYEDTDKLLESLFPEAKIIRMAPTGAEQVAFWINMISPLLILGGILGLYIEFKTPGFGLFGIIGLVCFLIYFIGLFIAGLSGYETIILFSLGVILIIVELFIWPGHVLPGFLGVCLILVAVLYGGAERQPQAPPQEITESSEESPQDSSRTTFEKFILPTLQAIEKPLMDLLIGVTGAVLAILLLSKYLPETSVYHRLVLAAPDSPLPPSMTAVDSPGISEQQGVAETNLHPSGKARFNGKLLDVVTEGEMIKAGSSVVIVKRDGFKTVVRGV